MILRIPGISYSFFLHHKFALCWQFGNTLLYQTATVQVERKGKNEEVLRGRIISVSGWLDVRHRDERTLEELLSVWLC